MARRKAVLDVPQWSDDAAAEEMPFISEDQLALSFRFHFSWGYPDYVHHAFQTMFSAGTTRPVSADSDLSWRQLRGLMEEADSQRIKYLVAGNPNTPPSVLDFLAQQGDERICERIAENPRAHKATLARLALNSSPTVRAAVSEHINASEETLQLLACDIDADVRYRMAENFKLPGSILEMLAQDENPYVSARAKSTLSRNSGGAEVIPADFTRNIFTRRQQRFNSQ